MRMVSFLLKKNKLVLLLVAAVVVFVWNAIPQTTKSYQFNIVSITDNGPGNAPDVVRRGHLAVVTYSVTDRSTGQAVDILNDLAFTATASGASRLFHQIGWSTRDFTNEDSGTNQIDPASATNQPFARGAAYPIPINALAGNVIANGDGTFQVTAPLPIPLTASGTGEVAMEGHPAGQDANGNFTVRIPVKNVYKYFLITGTSTRGRRRQGVVEPRRQVVDVNKCMACHRSDGTGVAPRLTLHGSNRTEEPQVCVVCHNPNQTDIPFRQAADATNFKVVVGSHTYPEQSVDFKRLVHGIHASSAGFRDNPLVVIGRNHTVFDASLLTPFPASLRNCVNCHIDNGTQGTFELPLGANVLGSTFTTGSTLGGAVDADPANDVKITPTASVCSSCHDGNEVISHMMNTGGASFSTTQAAIDSGAVRERCVECHGPGKEEDVRRVHLSGDDD